MKTVSKKLFSLLLVAVLLVSVLPFQASASTITFNFYTRNGGSFELLPQNVRNATPSSVGAVAINAAPANPEIGGLKFLGWVLYTPGMTVDQVNAAPVVNLSNLFTGDTSFAAKYATDSYTVSFSTGYADITNPASITVINTTSFGYNATMPFPDDEPNGYTFGGWKYGEKTLTLANWDTEIFNSKANVTLTAVWIPDALTVTFYRFNDSVKGYEAIKAVTVKYGETVKLKDIPALSDLDARDKYEPIGWQTSAGTDAKAIDPATTTITADTGFYARYLGDEVTINFDPNDSNIKVAPKVVRIGEKVGAYGGKLPTPSLTGYVFMGWYVEKDQSAQVTKVTDEDIFWNSYNTLYARWAPQGSVRLIVYKEGDNVTPIVSRLIPGGVRGGTLDVDTIQIGNYLPAGATYQLTGYFNKAGWDDYVLNRIVNTVDYVQVASEGETPVYAVVKVVSTNTNTGSGTGNTGSGTGTPAKPADPTNPATGDNSMIFTSMTVMTLSAAALVVFMQLRKRKMI